MVLQGSTKSKINKDEKSENMPHVEIAEVVLIHCNIINNDYQLLQKEQFKKMQKQLII